MRKRCEKNKIKSYNNLKGNNCCFCDDTQKQKRANHVRNYCSHVVATANAAAQGLKARGLKACEKKKVLVTTVVLFELLSYLQTRSHHPLHGLVTNDLAGLSSHTRLLPAKKNQSRLDVIRLDSTHPVRWEHVFVKIPQLSPAIPDLFQRVARQLRQLVAPDRSDFLFLI